MLSFEELIYHFTDIYLKTAMECSICKENYLMADDNRFLDEFMKLFTSLLLASGNDPSLDTPQLIENLNAKGLRDKINVTINNCYPVKEVLSVKEILDKHDLLLNTSGEVEIDSVFQDYRKVSNI